MEKKKEKHSILGSYLYMLGAATRIDRLYPAKLFGYIISKLALPLVASLLPAAAVALLAEGGDVFMYLTGMAVLALLYGAAQFAGQILESLTGIRESSILQCFFLPQLYRKTLTMDYCSLESEKGQTQQNRAYASVLNSTDGLEGELQFGRSCILNLTGMLFYGGIAVALEPLILPVLLAMFFLHLALLRLSADYFDKTKEERFRAEAKLQYLYEESQDAKNGKDARVYGMEKWFRDSMLENVNTVIRWFRRYFLRDFLPEASDNLFVLLRDLLAYTVLVNRFLEGSITAAEFTFSIGLIATFSRWMDGFIRDQSGMQHCSFMVKQYRDFINIEDVFHHGKGENTDTLSIPPGIVFEDVSFMYPESETPVIEHLNLTIRPGERIALVGINGAGKTTLVKLLSGMHLPTKGRILIDGIPSIRFNIEDYYKLTATLYQDVNVLPCTIGENVAGTDHYDAEKVLACLETAGLGERIRTLKKGIETSLTQKLNSEGVLLSGGELQRVLFARALYKGSPVLILDEPTAALDPLAEADLYRKYAACTENKTSIFISHRLSSTRFCDRILFMEDGKILEEGSHAELLQKNGAYAHMFRIQSQYYREEAANE